MELKHYNHRGDLPRNNGSNRTFMELKLLFKKFTRALNKGSNRTFMELKQASNSGCGNSKGVLIVPLWN